MDKNKTYHCQKNRYLKLSLKKNEANKLEDEPKKLNRSSDVIVIDESHESLDKLRLEFPKIVQSNPKIYSPIVINDSCDLSNDDLPEIALPDKGPSKCGNVSFNCSADDPSPTKEKESRPSIGGWSPAQHIITATPRHDHIPSTPKDLANESQEQCSIKKIQQSQKKILNDLYGNAWKSIPTLFKTISHKYDNFNGVSKKLQFDDDGDKENIRKEIKINKELYLTASETKRYEINFGDTDKKSKKKLYTEKVPSTPDVPKIRARIDNSTTKKVKVKKGMSVTELVEVMRKDVDLNNEEEKGVLSNRNENEILTKKTESEKRNDNVDILRQRIQNVSVTPSEKVIGRLSFMGSLADNIPSWRCHPEALQYQDNYKTLREQLTRRLYVEFNKAVFGDAMDADMAILWDSKLRSTAGTTTNRLIKNAKGDRIRTSSIKLSTKVVDAPQRLRDTLIHELCHAATWLIDAELRAGHGPLWKKWATRALRVYPELGEISRCHDLEIHFKYSYKCTKCGYSIQRHSKSIDVTKKCCGYCRGTFEIVLNKKNKDGVVVSTPARKAGPNEFAQFVKEHYANIKDGSKTHAQVMKALGEQFSARKNKGPL